jgi:catechol 2,3-dioxygenase-like lactoylglutathione lyase family enzyme
MTIQRMDHVGIVVDDLAAATAFFVELGVPVWVAAMTGNVKPLRRAARYDGFFPASLKSVDEFAQAVAAVRDLRGNSTAPYDIAVELPPGNDPAPYVDAGATWCMTGLEPGVSRDEVRGVLREGPVQ